MYGAIFSSSGEKDSFLPLVCDPLNHKGASVELRDADEKHDFGSLAVHNFNCEGELEMRLMNYGVGEIRKRM